MDRATKHEFVIPHHPDVSVSRQTELLDISRSGYYYRPVIDEEDVCIMACMDRVFTEYPFYGSRRMKKELEEKPYEIFICREHVQHLMRVMGLEAIYPKQRGLSNPAPEHKKYPYLLSNIEIVRPNQVWGTDITYVKLAHGFCYLIALLDWFSRYVITWQLSETLELPFCLENLEQALQINKPEIHNSDQGSHFTSNQYTDILTRNNIHISMDGRGRCMDNIFTERLWRSVKYENIYIYSYQNIHEANIGLQKYFEFYNNHRKHQSLAYQTPSQIYFRN